jgi:5-aminopentanamidase
MRIRIACGQFTAVPGDAAANARLMGLQAREAAEAGARLVVFPELALTGYLAPELIPPLAARLDGPEVAAVRAAARTAGIAVCFGLAELLRDGTRRNSMAFLDPTGEVLAVYHKTHLWDTERLWAAPGEGFPTVSFQGALFGMWICYDTRFPECARSYYLSGATCALVATAWLGPAEEWELAVRARAMDNCMFVAASALQGGPSGLSFHGGSLVADPHGRIVARAPEGFQGVITADYDAGDVSSARARLPLAEHRRPDLYIR